MSENPGAHLVGQYLKEVKGCDFVEYNLQTKYVQGEIDVVGINSNEKKVYVCEVATHLQGLGLQYTKNNRPDNVERLITKFAKDIEYADRNFKAFAKEFMFWTPIARNSREGSSTNPFRDLQDIKSGIKVKTNIHLTVVANEDYLKAVGELRKIAAKKTEELTSPIMRFLQIEEKLKKYCGTKSKLGR